jgi:DNA helicase-2/ATP-dependent DNA helicase PcrA
MCIPILSQLFASCQYYGFDFYFLKGGLTLTINEQEQQFESNRLHHVIELIGNHIVKTEKITDDRKSNAWEIKREFWSDITVNVDDPDDIMETISAVKQQAFVLSTQENSKKHAEQQLYQLKRMKQSPYFARIDFIEEGTTQKEPIYIGIASFMDERTDEYWVYDWRAPISNLFYDYGPGPASYVTPMGSIEGRIELKRQYVIRNGIIKYMFDTGVTIGDEMLQQLLSKSADEHMKSIVATIQKEQNQIIRDDSHRLLIVQGSAGSGKTSVALQRVAYLLYKHRQSLNADNMVLFSPNSIFNSYVSSVLPELGEANMEQTTYQEYLRLRLGSRFELEDPYTQLEYVLTASADQDYNSRLSSIRYKASTEFFRVISSYKSYLEQTGMLFKNITLQGRILISGQTLANRFYQFDSSTKLANRIVLLKDWILKELRELEKQERRQEWVKNEIELLDKDQYYRAYNKLRKMSPNEFDSFDSQDREEEIL